MITLKQASGIPSSSKTNDIPSRMKMCEARYIIHVLLHYGPGTAAATIMFFAPPPKCTSSTRLLSLT
eukprot:TRINITY_DN13817_c0_g1_i1.p2 TRINITY_DN13817_c0_g1~~TRINITY_DN13817_c0_g1_i1.p2  ORF type:complete len:67 (-),score=5.28 TRINITY_DN13817_c0_g1_i1:93-293(-)